MQMSENNRFFSFALDSAHVKCDVKTSLREHHDLEPDDIAQSFKILMKCQNKFDCLVFEMFVIKDLKPTLNKQSDSIRTKLFV